MRRLKKLCSVLIASALTFSLAACGGDKVKWDMDYHPETDLKQNMEYPLDSLMSETDKGYYFINGLYLYYMNKDTLETTVLCNRPNCLHDREKDPEKKGECDGCVMGKGIFSHDDNIYVSMFYGTVRRIDKYSDSGEFIGTVNELPPNASYICHHRGYIFYVYSDLEEYITEGMDTGRMPSGQYYIMKVPVDGGEAEVVYECPLDGNQWVNVTIDNIYGNMIYAKEDGTLLSEGSEGERVYRDIIIDLTDNSYEYFDGSGYSTGIKTPYDDGIVYSRWYSDNDKRNNVKYKTDYNLQGNTELFTSEYDNAYSFWDGEYWYDTNLMDCVNGNADYQEFTVYDKERNEICRFDFTNVDGHDFSKEQFYNPIITDRYLFVKTMRDESGVYMLCVDKDDFKNGNPNPYVVWELSSEYLSTEIAVLK